MKDLEVHDKKVHSFEEKNYSENVTSELKVKTANVFDSSVFKSSLETEKSSKDVSTIYSEFTKEVKVNSIDKQSAAKVSATQRKLNKNDHSQFKTSLTKVKSFGGNNTAITPRSRQPRSNTTQIQKLSEVEKKSISDFFDKFKDLSQEQTKFSTELSKAAGGGDFSKLTQDVCLSCIPGNLRTIGWTSKDLNVFHKKSRVTHSPINKYQYYSDNQNFEISVAKSTWGDWNNTNHPYRHFFNTEQDWLNAVQQMSDVWKAYYGKLNNKGRRTCSVISFVLPIGDLCTFNKNQLEQKIEDARASLELKIGTKLMKIMQRLDK